MWENNTVYLERVTRRVHLCGMLVSLQDHHHPHHKITGKLRGNTDWRMLHKGTLG